MHRFYTHGTVSAGTNLACVRRAICAGYFSHAAKKDSDSDEQGAYKIVGKDVLVRIHPSSALFYRAPEWLVYHELTVTAGKAYCHDVTAVEPEWLVEVAPTP